MKPRQYMIMGAWVGGMFVAFSFIEPSFPMWSFYGFAAGALFGKGYGIWEERARSTRGEPR